LKNRFTLSSKNFKLFLFTSWDYLDDAIKGIANGQKVLMRWLNLVMEKGRALADELAPNWLRWLRFPDC